MKVSQQAIAVLKGFSVPMMTVLQWCSHFCLKMMLNLFTFSCGDFSEIKTHTIHVWHIYLHVGFFPMVNLGRYTIYQSHGCYGKVVIFHKCTRFVPSAPNTLLEDLWLPKNLRQNQPGHGW